MRRRRVQTFEERESSRGVVMKKSRERDVSGKDGREELSKEMVHLVG